MVFEFKFKLNKVGFNITSSNDIADIWNDIFLVLTSSCKPRVEICHESMYKSHASMQIRPNQKNQEYFDAQNPKRPQGY